MKYLAINFNKLDAALGLGFRLGVVGFFFAVRCSDRWLGAWSLRFCS